MKLIIDIPEEDREDINNIHFVREDLKFKVGKAIMNGTPFDSVIEDEPKKGEWKKISPAGIYECSCCGQNLLTLDIECYKFCHGCGASMGVKK